MLTLVVFSTGLSMAFIAVLAIAGWVFGAPLLAAWGAAAMPMAPLTAAVSAAMGTSLVLCAFQKQTRYRRAQAFALSTLSLLVALLALFAEATGWHPAVETLGLSHGGTVSGWPVGFMSPVAALGLAVSAGALTVQMLPRVDRQTRLITALFAATAVIGVGLVSVLTTSLGYPLLARSAHIPMAANTGAVLIAFGIGLAALGIRLSDLSSRRVRPSDRSWRPLALAFVALVLITVVVSYAFYRQEEKEMRSEEDTRLEDVAVVLTTNARAIVAAPLVHGEVIRTRAIPGSDWSLMWTSSDKELRADLWTRLRQVLTFSTLLLVCAGLLLVLLWQRHRLERGRERAALAEALRLQAIRERELVARSPAVLYTLHVDDGRLVPIDRSANVERILGYTVAEALDPAWFPTHVFADDREAAFAALKVLDTADEMANEFRFTRRDGSVLWVLNQMTVTRREAGRPVEVTGAWHDITERRKAETALRESEERLRLALAAAKQGLWDLDVQTGEAIVSPEYATMLGYDPGEFRESRARWVERQHPDDREPTETQFRDYLDGRIDSYHIECRQRTRSGEWKWILSRGKLIAWSPDGRPLRMLGIHTDIHARKMAELRLRESESRYRLTAKSAALQAAALRAAANAIVITNRNGVIEWVNPAFSALTGFTVEEAVGRNPRDLVKSGAQDTPFYEQMWDTIIAGRVWEGELTNRRKDGTMYLELQTITPVVDASGDITHFVGIKRDLTGERRLQEQFLQAQKMEVVGRLAGGIAHDFNNLLTVINGESDLAISELPDGDPMRETLGCILEAGKRAARLTSQLLAFSRKQVPSPAVVSAGGQVTGLAPMIRRLIGEDIVLSIDLAEPSVSDRVRIDRGQFEQLLLNLAVNARDAMPGGGALAIRVRAGANAVRIAITDTGTGIAPEIRARLFEPFFTTKPQGKGTGLGLATVYAIVTQNGGTLEVESTQGRGSTFTIQLPAVAEACEPAAEAQAISRGDETIVLVEDERGIRELTARMLRSVGYAVLPMETGAAALAWFTTNDRPVHLLLSDVVMPGLTGPELAAAIQSIRPDLPVLFASGYADDKLTAEVLADPDRFIAKPYPLAELAAKVRRIIDAQAAG